MTLVVPYFFWSKPFFKVLAPQCIFNTSVTLVSDFHLARSQFEYESHLPVLHFMPDGLAQLEEQVNYCVVNGLWTPTSE